MCFARPVCCKDIILKMEMIKKIIFVFFLLILVVIPMHSAVKQYDAMILSNCGTGQLPEQPDTNKVEDLSEIVVTDYRLPKEILPVQVLHGETLKKLSVHSVADAIRYFSGVQIKDYGGIGGLKTVNVRSMGSHHVGVFYDGVELGNAQNGVVDLGRFSLDNMEALSLYNGQKSALFQPAKDYASASSLYLTTRKPVITKERKYNLELGLNGGSFGTINPSVLYEQRLGSKVTSSFNAEYMYTTGKYKFSYAKKDGYDTTEVRKNGDVSALRIEGGLYGNITNGEWKAKVYYYNSERGYPGASVREEPGKFKHQDRQWDHNFFVQGSFRKDFTKFYSLLANAKYAYDYLHYLSDPRLDVTTMYVNNHYKQNEVYGSVANLFNLFKWWNVSLSADAQYNTLDADLVDFVYPKRLQIYSAASTSLQFGEQFAIQGSILHTYVHDETTPARDDIDESTGAWTGKSMRDKSKFSPAVTASWTPFKGKEIGKNNDLTVRAFYKNVFRMPTLNDLYYTFIGNKDLNPEYTTQYDFGLTYLRTTEKGVVKSFEIKADAYYNEVTDKIIAMPTSNQFRWTMINLGFVKIRGVDATVGINWQFREVGIDSRITYTYQKAQDRTDKTSAWYGGQIPYIPWHSGSAIVQANWRGWNVNYSFIYTGERYEAVANIQENYEQPWYTHDIAFSKEFTLKPADAANGKRGLRMMATLEINNIGNQQYEVVRCYPMPGTNFKIKLKFKL